MGRGAVMRGAGSGLLDGPGEGSAVGAVVCWGAGLLVPFLGRSIAVDFAWFLGVCNLATSVAS